VARVGIESFAARAWLDKAATGARLLKLPASKTRFGFERGEQSVRAFTFNDRVSGLELRSTVST
jgi:hypothetical protein